jgi:hypothetical protein
MFFKRNIIRTGVIHCRATRKCVKTLQPTQFSFPPPYSTSSCHKSLVTYVQSEASHWILWIDEYLSLLWNLYSNWAITHKQRTGQQHYNQQHCNQCNKWDWPEEVCGCGSTQLPRIRTFCVLPYTSKNAHNCSVWSTCMNTTGVLPFFENWTSPVTFKIPH